MDSNDTLDYYLIDDLLSAEEKAIRDKVRQFVDQECIPIIADYFNKGAFPMQLIARMAEMGLFGVHLDGYGCRKTNETIYGLISQELGRGDSGLRAMFSKRLAALVYLSLILDPTLKACAPRRSKKGGSMF
jgi:glutaryl-CoA dehydrogenase